MPRLVVTAVDAERDAVLAGLPDDAGITVATVGVGPAAAAAGTARLLAHAEAAGRPFRAVIAAGIAGGFPGRAAIGDVVLATRSIQADLGADSPDGFLSLDQLGFGTATVPTDPALRQRLAAALPHAVVGDVLTVATVTGTAARAIALADTHPTAVAEAMRRAGCGVRAGRLAWLRCNLRR